MKKLNKILGMLVIEMLAVVASAITASAAIGDDYSVGGVGLGWVLVGIVVVIALIAWGMQVTKAAIKPFVPILAVLLIVGLALQYVEVAPEAADITDTVTWEVSATVDAGNMTIDNDARTINIQFFQNTTDAKINGTTATLPLGCLWVAPIINFTISPEGSEGITTTASYATTRGRVNNPDTTFTEDAATYDLFADASSSGNKDVVWTADGTTAYETRLCTVDMGSSETVLLTLGFLQTGLYRFEIGDSTSFTITLGGITYTATIMCTGSSTFTTA